MSEYQRSLAELPTPAALVDLDVVRANTTRMAKRMTELGVDLRAHVKTHKTAEGARLQTHGHSGAITVSTLAEAAAFADAGFDDITWAMTFGQSRIEDVLTMSARVPRFHVVVDDLGMVQALDAAAHAAGKTVSCWMAVDTGYGREGVDPHTESAFELARGVRDSVGLSFAGVLTHAGHSYHCRRRAEIEKVARQEVDGLVKCAERLRAAGVPCPGVSVGSTPTMSVVEDLEGVTEVRPGNYIFYDGFQAAIGACKTEDIALTVLTTTIGCYPERGKALVDAGALALSKDAGATHIDASGDMGALRAVSGEARPDLRLTGLSQEHGHIRGTAAALPRVGERLRVVPHHSCMTAALFNELVVVQGGTVVDRWRPVRGWNAGGNRA